MNPELIILRVIHVLGGLFWVGAGLYNTIFVFPALNRIGGPVPGQVMGALQQRRLFVVMPIVAALTVLSGARLWWIVGGGWHYFQHRSGHIFAVSGIFAIVSFIVGMAISRPAGVRAGTLARSAASDETSRNLIAGEIAKLQRRAIVSGHVAIALLILAAVGMAVARYL
jgi:hypothetical protein